LHRDTRSRPQEPGLYEECQPDCQVAENLQTWYLKATRGSVLNREVLSPQDPNLEFSK